MTTTTDVRKDKVMKGQAPEARYTLPLDDPWASLAATGGKGASLARLSSAGLPVPEGFHVTTGAYNQLVAENDLQPAIMAALKQADPARPATLEAASLAIRELFAQAHMPEAVAQAIAGAYQDLPGDGPVVAVRSSATAEDLPDLSFAGQQDTYLNIDGLTAVQDAVKRCWASLWTARAIGYRMQHHIDQEAVSLAVVVQILVNAEAAGILFTANPVDGQRGQVMISAAWGLGEAVVGGMVTPDTLTLDKATGGVVARQTADKQVMTVRVEGGTEEQPVPDDLRRVPVLDDRAAAELVHLGIQIEELYGLPMDIEWALAGGKFAILQARPITALPEPETPASDVWKLPNKGPFMRGSVVDFMPDPLSPLFSTLGRARYNSGMKRMLESLRMENIWPEDFLTVINGYAYMSGNISPRQMASIVFILLSKLSSLVRTAVPRWRDEAVPRYTSVVKRWQEARPPAEMQAAELLTGVYEVFDAAVEHLATLQSGVIGMAGGAEGLFAAAYNKLARREGDPDPTVFVLGYDSMPILAEKALYDLGQWCRSDPGLASYVRATPTDRLVTELAGDRTPDGLDAEVWSELRARFRGYLDGYGFAIYNFDFARALPADEPAPLVEMLKLYVSGQGTNPHERQQKAAARREAAAASTLGRLKGLKLKIVRTVLGWAQNVAPLREDGIAFIGYGYPLLRKMFRELGRRLVGAGAVEQADDIFWLTETEVRQAVDALDRGEAVGSFIESIEARRAEWRAQKRQAPPPMLPPRKTYMGINMAQWLPASAEAQAEDTLKGVPASPGRVTAPACVLHGPEDFDQMRPGDVLVAGITTPAWTPLFAMASAVVTDIGGPLSHGSIVAREYGIPAVLGTGVATHRIHSGQIITVDGGAGLVTLADGKDPAD